MTAYCTEKLAGTAHTCLCTALAHHPGGHRCACGHTWGDPWHEMTYDQQRAWLGLPELLPAAHVFYTWLPGDPIRVPWVVWHWNDDCTLTNCVCSARNKEAS